jgi:hypothetical protein
VKTTVLYIHVRVADFELGADAYSRATATYKYPTLGGYSTVYLCIIVILYCVG